MCGICGKIGATTIEKNDILKMVSLLNYRGPDDRSFYLNGSVALGHTRLSIIDISNGKQPMTNETGDIIITFNGEIYNYKEIKSILRERHFFKTNCDTEAIIHLYEEKGLDCLNYLRGMFAFAIYDNKKKRLFLARDHLGQKPLFYLKDGLEFSFASEIKALLHQRKDYNQMAPEALYEYLTLRIITPPRTMFKMVKKLPPGHYLTLQNNKIRINRYWNLDYTKKIKKPFRQILEDLDAKINTTVEYHLVSDVSVGAFLSGGLDSSLIVAMMSKKLKRPFNTFNGDIPYLQYSESHYAKIVAEMYGTEHHQLTLNPSLIKNLTDLVWHLDEPSDPLSVCIYVLSKYIRNYVKVVIGGDGGDEMFGGYDRYYGNILTSYYALIPERLRNSFLKKLIELIPEGFWYRSISHQIKWMQQMSFSKGGVRYAKSLGYFYFSELYKRRLYTNKFINQVGMFDPECQLVQYFDSENAEKLIDKMLYTDSMTRMPDHPVMILDRMTMAHGLEARSPFLDHKLAEFCASIPPEYKVKRNKRRYIQLELARRYLPKKLITRKKQGFNSPLPYMLKKEFSFLFKIFLQDSSLVRDGYLKQTGINELLSEHMEKRIDHGNRLWLLCNAEIWYRMFIENQSRNFLKEKIINSKP